MNIIRIHLVTAGENLVPLHLALLNSWLFSQPVRYPLLHESRDPTGLPVKKCSRPLFTALQDPDSFVQEEDVQPSLVFSLNEPRYGGHVMDPNRSEPSYRNAIVEALHDVAKCSYGEANELLDTVISTNGPDRVANELISILGDEKHLVNILGFCETLQRSKPSSEDLSEKKSNEPVARRTFNSPRGRERHQSQDGVRSSSTKPSNAGPPSLYARIPVASGPVSRKTYVHGERKNQRKPIRATLGSNFRAIKESNIGASGPKKGDLRSPIIINCLGCGKIHFNVMEQEFVCTSCHKLVGPLMEKEIYASEGLREAIAHKDRILSLDRDAVARSRITDRASDFSEEAQSLWISSKEREELLEKAAISEKRKEENEGKKSVTINWKTMRLEEQDIEEEAEPDIAEISYKHRLKQATNVHPRLNRAKYSNAKYIVDASSIPNIDTNEDVSPQPTATGDFRKVEVDYYSKDPNDLGEDLAMMCYIGDNADIIADVYGDEPAS